MEKGQKVIVNDPGLLMLQKFAPPDAKPNNVGWIEEIEGDFIMVKFPIGDDNAEKHSQIAPYRKHLVELKEW